jgi:xanthine dehydrogenase YagS FAD-binding subunit
MKDQVVAPKIVVNVKGIESMTGMKVEKGVLRIGANMTLTAIAEHAAVNKHLPALAKSARELGSTQIRNVATLGGNLCQRHRDWYYRNGLDPDVKEELQYGAIFPAENQTYVHPSTLAPVLMAYGAAVHTEGPKGSRTILIDALFQVADGKTKREIVLAPNEIITSVDVTINDAQRVFAIEVRERQSHDWPLVQAAAAVTMNAQGVASAAKIVLGHVAPVPIVSETASAAIVGKMVDVTSASAAGKAAAQGAKATPKNEYKTHLVQIAVKRALLGAVGKEYWRAQA